MVSFYEFCTTQFNPADLSQLQRSSADEILRQHLDAYEQYLEGSDLLQPFRQRREQLFAVAPGVQLRRPTGWGVVQGSQVHFARFTESCRRQYLGNPADDDDEELIDLYEWASGFEAPESAILTFDRSVELVAEEMRRELYGQPQAEERRNPIIPPGGRVAIPQPSAVRSEIYGLLDESENYNWGFGNPVPGLLRPLLSSLIEHIAYQTVPSEQEALFWARRIEVAAIVIGESIDAGLRVAEEDEPVVPFDLSGAPRRHSLVESLIRRGRQSTADRLAAEAEALRRSQMEAAEASQIDVADDEYGFWVPTGIQRTGSPRPSQREVRDFYWNLAGQEDITEETRAELVELADQSSSESASESHVRVQDAWFDRGNILGDRRPPDMGPARHPWDSYSDSGADENTNLFVVHQHWAPYRDDSDSDDINDTIPVPLGL